MSSVQTKASTMPQRRHVLVAAFPAFGHIVPLIELARKIVPFHDVTFAISSTVLPELKKRELIKPSDTIRVHAVDDSAVHMGKVEVSADKADAKDAMKTFFMGASIAMGKFLTIMPTKAEPGSSDMFPPVDVVISDIFLSKPAAVLKQRGIPSYLFNAGVANFVQFLLSMSEDTPTYPDADHMEFMKLAEAGVPAPPQPKDLKDVFYAMKEPLNSATGLIVNSFREIELDALREIAKDPITAHLTIHCIGPLLPEEEATTKTAELEMETKVSQWLDGKQENSVVYVSFGSVATPTPAQLKEIGQALLDLGQPFIFALREQHHSSLPEEIATQISSQFDGADGRFIILNWAPQKLVLGHSAVAVFVSHCGWNSTLESLSNGKPIAGWPMFADQLANAQWAAKLCAGLVVSDNGMKCLPLVPAKDIVDVIEKIGGWRSSGDKQSTYTEAAVTWGDKIHATWKEGGSSAVEFADLIQFHQ